MQNLQCLLGCVKKKQFKSFAEIQRGIFKVVNSFIRNNNVLYQLFLQTENDNI